MEGKRFPVDPDSIVYTRTIKPIIGTQSRIFALGRDDLEGSVVLFVRTLRGSEQIQEDQFIGPRMDWIQSFRRNKAIFDHDINKQIQGLWRVVFNVTDDRKFAEKLSRQAELLREARYYGQK